MAANDAVEHVALNREDARRLIEVLDGCAVLLRNVATDDRVIDIAAASLLHAAEDWAQLLRSELNDR